MSEYASTADAARIPRLDDSRIQWRDATSGKGRKIKIGTLKPDDSEVALNEADLLGTTEVQGRTVGNRAIVGVMDTVDHISKVHWPVGDDKWKTPAQDVIDNVKISKYYLTTNSGWYDYTLHITNTENWDYTFYDESDDYYTLSTFLKCDHYVSYDSTLPTIVKIKATE